MDRLTISSRDVAFIGTLFVGLIWTVATSLAQAPNIENGKYVMTTSGCVGCHTTKEDHEKGLLLGGGRALKTPFGLFYSPNITPDPVNGIGNWTEANFHEAMRNGKNPAGEHYLPVFPYTSFTQMTDDDIRDLWAYMKTVPSLDHQNIPHGAPFIFRMRFTLGPWKMINFKAGAYEPDKDQSAEWNRGAYLVNALAHCGECHTPRNLMGGLKSGMYHAGAQDGPEGEAVPNITMDKATGIGDWSEDDFDTLFTMGMLPDGDFVGSGMAEVIENTGKLTPEDKKAIITYLMTVPPIENKVQ